MAAENKGKTEATDMGLDDDKGPIITLKSSDAKAFEIPRNYAFLSTLIKTSCESDAAATELPLSGVKGDVLAKIVEYLNHHQGKDPGVPEKPLRSKNMKEVCSSHPWDADFIDGVAANKQGLYDVILGANYLDIKSLLHLGCAKVASMIKGVPLAKIKTILDPAVPYEPEAAAAPAAKSSDDKKEE